MSRVRTHPVASCLAALGLVALLLASAGAQAAPADDHARGKAAYDRGDVVDAMKILRAPAAAGHAPSQVLLAFILDRADFADQAFALYRNAAAQGDPEGQAGLANAYLTGRGVAKDENSALQHFSKAAAQGHVRSILVLADLYIRGDAGLGAAPSAQALAALTRAADHGHLPAIDALADAHARGRWGLAPDPAQAQQWQARGRTLRTQRAAMAPASAAAGASRPGGRS